MALAQAQGQKPVTEAEFVRAEHRIRVAFDQTLELKETASPDVSKLTGALTKDRVLIILGEAMAHFQGSFVSHPRPHKVDMAKLEKRVSKPALPAAADLLKWGMIAPTAPVVTSKEALTAKQLGDALGYFYSRIAYLCHKPIPKFSPYLEPQGG